MGLPLDVGCDRYEVKPKRATIAGHADGPVHIMQTGGQLEIDAFVRSIIQRKGMQDSFYVLDLGLLVRLFQGWVKALPRVKPFYAVKCNPDSAMIMTLASLGAGFDCASKAEISQVLALGVPADQIVFANPCKMLSHVAYAASVGVNLMTFDSESEIHKVKAHHPGAVLLLRLRTDDRAARCPLGVKYGALMCEVENLLCVAAQLHVPVAGVSFHIGSGATDALSFVDAIAAAREVFDVALRLKLPAMKILDIGGGFTSGSTGLKFLDASVAVNTALDAYFPPNTGVTIIAEPGRYFAETPATLATTVIGKRVRANIREYWINDGIYGSMNCLLYDHAKLKYRPLLVSMEEESGDLHTDWMAPIFHSSTVFGPTCDGLDTVLQGALLPELSIGDWILFPNMGAYTAAAGSSFNGFATSDIPTFYAFSVNFQGCPAAALSILKGLLPEVMKMLLSEVNFDTFGVEENSEVSGSGSGSQLISVSNGGYS